MDLSPNYSLLFLIWVPGFLFLAIRAFKESDRWLYRFARIRKPRQPYMQSVVYLALTLTAIICALSQPGVRYEQARFNRSGIDLIIGIDISKSMLAEDAHFHGQDKRVFPTWNRLNRARVLSMKLLSRLEGERVGIFIFGRQGIEVVPLTGDYGYCRYVLKHINEQAITVSGSDIAQAIRTGLDMFSGPRRSRAIILFSDGEDLNPDPFYRLQEAKQAAVQQVRIYTVGVGTPEYSLIPMRNGAGDRVADYYRDEKGAVLQTRAQPDTLKTIARITGGSYRVATESELPVKLIGEIVNHARSIDQIGEKILSTFDLTPFFLLGGLFFFLAGILPAT